MRKFKNLVIILVCFLCYGIGALIAANTSTIIYANAYGYEGNENFDVLYKDIVERYNYELITLDEAEAEYTLLSQNNVIVNIEKTSESFHEVSTMSMTSYRTVSGSVSWIPSSGASAEPLRKVRIELRNGLTPPTLI